ncbi:MAG TPA: SDR family oxidoreductase [Xanthobacteraceae bacterium]|jgi:glucose 1-dehydrogenase
MPSNSPALLSGQVALVTGASSGIGAATAIALAQAGARIGVNYLDRRQSAEEIAGHIRKAGGHAVVLKADVSKESDVRCMFSELIDAFGRLDILVANAGLQRDSQVTSMTLEQWRSVIDVNLTGQFLCARDAIKQFLAQKPSSSSKAIGKIICMSSVHEVIPWAGHVNYAASKGGIMLMMKSLAQEVAEKKIRVNGIAPGAIRTSINRSVWSDPEQARALLELIPYGRIGEPEDIARAAVWLASDESDYVTGTTLFVDGGMTLYPEFREGG